VVPQEVEVKMRVNPLPSYLAEYKMMYSKWELEQIQANIKDCEREAIVAGCISTHWLRTLIVGSPRSPIVEEVDSPRGRNISQSNI